MYLSRSFPLFMGWAEWPNVSLCLCASTSVRLYLCVCLCVCGCIHMCVCLYVCGCFHVFLSTCVLVRTPVSVSSFLPFNECTMPVCLCLCVRGVCLCLCVRGVCMAPVSATASASMSESVSMYMNAVCVYERVWPGICMHPPYRMRKAGAPRTCICLYFAGPCGTEHLRPTSLRVTRSRPLTKEFWNETNPTTQITVS